MKKPAFLNKLRNEGKLAIVESSEEMKESYLRKSDNCLKSAKILLQNDLHENSVAEAYYAIYNCLLALLYKTGIKSENHSASIILLGKIFKANDLVKLASSAKEERIDKQYYVEAEQKNKVTKESCNEMIVKAEDFVVRMKLLINNLNNEDIIKARVDFQNMFDEEPQN